MTIDVKVEADSTSERVWLSEGIKRNLIRQEVAVLIMRLLDKASEVCNDGDTCLNPTISSDHGSIDN